MKSGRTCDACHVCHTYREVMQGGRTFDQRPQDTPSPGDGQASSLIELGCVVALGGHLSLCEIAHEADVWAWVQCW